MNRSDINFVLPQQQGPQVKHHCVCMARPWLPITRIRVAQRTRGGLVKSVLLEQYHALTKPKSKWSDRGGTCCSSSLLPMFTSSFGGARSFSTVSNRNISSVVKTLAERSLHDPQYREDPAQRRVAQKLDRLLDVLHSTRAPYNPKPVLAARLLQEEKDTAAARQQVKQDDDKSRNETKQEKRPETGPQPSSLETHQSSLPKIPRGLYLHGPVGTGKTLLLDLFVDCYRRRCRSNRNKTQPGVEKVHFHAFMQRLHRQRHLILQQQQQQQQKQESILFDSFARGPTLTQRVARQIARQTSVLCLDEFQLSNHDPADGYLLMGTLQELWYCGTVLVMSSNQAPSLWHQDTYGDVFRELLTAHCVVHCIRSETDYRYVRAGMVSNSEPMFIVAAESIDEDTTSEDIDARLKSFFERHGGKNWENSNVSLKQEVTLTVGFGRTICVSANPIGRYSFSELCKDGDWGALEFRALAQHHDFVVLGNVPKLSVTEKSEGQNQSNVSPKHLDQVQRFVLLMDELYEARIPVFCHGRAPPSELLVPLSIEEVVNEFTNLSAAQKSFLYSLRRAKSRLVEMTSSTWWDQWGREF